MKKGEKSFMEEDVNIDNIPSFIFYAPMKGARWSMGIIVPSITVRTGGIMLGIMLLIVMGIMLLIIFVFCRITIRRATKPLVRLASSADEMASGNFNAELPTIKYKDEIWQLRNSFAGMQQSLSQYMEKLKETTAAKATIENELKIAHNLQMAMLPKTFPPFPHRKDIDIYGSLSPAKEVGGDLFDYFIKDEKLYFCVGDVSGKGIPAALVMTVTRALFHTIASHAPNPSIIVQELSKMLTKGNDIMMFVTFFMGELDLKTGRLRYCNAGHDAPYLIGKEVTTLPCDSNIPLGVMDNWEYTIQETTIEKNTIIFLYTDGLNEAEAVNQELFGKENIMQALNQYLQLEEKNPRSLIESTRAAVREFVGEAEQSDDMTMLAIQYKCD
ncbi:MAG: SpoIIE family protein phosphatase [Prevotella sp.]|nr:SpoIIE family protein phosphatase [Prevotella sp.]